MSCNELEKFEVDPEGDVFLMTREKELRVSSKIMSTASKVFEVMLRPVFKEGVDLANDEKCHISLPDDDPVAMLALCCIIHHQLSGNPNVNSTDFTVKTAVLADKYDCMKAVYLWMESQSWRLLRTSGLTETKQASLLLVAYLSNNLLLFREITRRVLLWKTPISEVEFSDALPTGLVGKTP